MTEKRYYAIECEAPGGGYGPKAIVRYSPGNQFIERVDYLDLVLEVWLGGELIQDVNNYCVTPRLWDFLQRNNASGIHCKEMSVTINEGAHLPVDVDDVPRFLEMIVPNSAEAEMADSWEIKTSSIPDADFFTCLGCPLFVTEHAKRLLDEYQVTGVVYEEVRII